MLEIAILGYCIYFLISIYTSFSQISFVKNAKKQKAIILEESKYLEAGDYSIETQTLSIINTFYDFIIFFLWISIGLQTLDTLTNDFNGIIKAIIFINLFIIINWFLSLPFSLYTTFVLDKKYGFSNMTISLYIKDILKTSFLFLVFGSLVIAIISFIITTFDSWWIYGFVFIFIVILIINMLYPLIRDKMYDKFEKLKDRQLELKVEKLLNAVGFKSSGIFSIDASKRDNRLNAYFGGLGSTKRVVLFDTLIEKLSHNEILAVLGHELGHFKNNDIIKNIAMTGVVMFIFFMIFGNLPDELFLNLHIAKEPHSIITIFLMFSPVLSFFLMPLISLLSRYNEYAADKFGSDLQTKKDLVSALLKLANENKSFPLSHPLFIFFYYSHPPLVQRLKELEYKENN